MWSRFTPLWRHTRLAQAEHLAAPGEGDLPRHYSFAFPLCGAGITRIIDAITDDLRLMRACTDALESDGAVLAYALLAKVGTGLLAAFDQVQTAAAALRADIR